MAKDILKLGLKNLVGVPLLQAQSQLIGGVADPTSRSVLNVGVAAQAVGLAGENVKYANKKLKWLK